MRHHLNFHGPPLVWGLTIETDSNDGDALRRAHRIILSYFDHTRFKRTRQQKGRHHYRLAAVGEPIHRSVIETINGELYPRVRVWREDNNVKV